MEMCENELVARGLKGDHDFIIVLNNTVLASEICLF